VALCVTEIKCLVNRSLGSSRRPRNRTRETREGTNHCSAVEVLRVVGRRSALS
jgi:hypothetical protein